MMQNWKELALMARRENEELCKRNDMLLDENEKLRKERTELLFFREITGNHTLENLRTIISAAPKAKAGERVLVHSRSDYRLGENRCVKVEFHSEPMVEYLEGDEITDALVLANGGRVPCKWKNAIGDWVEGLLIAVDPNQETPSYVIMSKTSGAVGTGWKHCIIKKSDIEEN